MFRTSLLAVLLAGLAGLVAAPARMADVPELDGVYSCDGLNPAGRPYHGIVEIVRTDATYHLRWTFPRENDSALGIGIMSNGVLAVSYYGGATAGVVVYRIENDDLVGEWTVVGSEGGVYKETLHRLPEGDAPPPEPELPDLPDPDTHPAPRQPGARSL